MDKKSRDIFYGVVLIATLIIAITGATLAYFSYRTSSKDEAIKAHAGSLNSVYSDSDQVTAQADELIPSSFNVVKKVYQSHVAGGGEPTKNTCIDENNKQVCSVYRFSVRSDIDNQIYALLNTEYNDFTYLAYAVKDVNNNRWMTLDNNKNYMPLAACSNKNISNKDDCYKKNDDKKIYNTKAINSIYGYSNSQYKYEIIGPTTRIYDLVIFINENNKNQNIDQGKRYQGTITVVATDVIEKVLKGEAS